MRRVFLLRVGSSWIFSAAPETVSWRKEGLWQNPGSWGWVCSKVFALGEKEAGFFSEKQRVGDRKNNIKQLEFQWVLDF